MKQKIDGAARPTRASSPELATQSVISEADDELRARQLAELVKLLRRAKSLASGSAEVVTEPPLKSSGDSGLLKSS